MSYNECPGCLSSWKIIYSGNKCNCGMMIGMVTTRYDNINGKVETVTSVNKRIGKFHVFWDLNHNTCIIKKYVFLDDNLDIVQNPSLDDQEFLNDEEIYNENIGYLKYNCNENKIKTLVTFK